MHIHVASYPCSSAEERGDRASFFWGGAGVQGYIHIEAYTLCTYYKHTHIPYTWVYLDLTSCRSRVLYFNSQPPSGSKTRAVSSWGTTGRKMLNLVILIPHRTVEMCYLFSPWERVDDSKVRDFIVTATKLSRVPPLRFPQGEWLLS